MKTLGRGSYGAVFYDPVTDSAVKRTFHEGSTRIWMGNLRELDILVRCGEHPNIVTIKDVKIQEGSEEYNKVNIYMDHYKTNLHNYLKTFKNSHLELSIVRKIMAQILLALEYLHANKIIHRDLKPDNILIDPKTHRIALCDFGMADIHMRYQPGETRVTAPTYRAPEVFLKNNYSYEIDSWAAGIIFHYMLYQEHPFEYPHEKIKALEKEIDELIGVCNKTKSEKKRNDILDIIDEKRAQIDNEIYEGIREGNIRAMSRTKQPYHNLLLSLLETDPRKRCSVSQALDHPFFNLMPEDLISNTRKEFPPKPLKLNHIFIEKITERKWINKYTSKFTSDHKDLNCEILFPTVFHGLDLFERYLMFCQKNNTHLTRESKISGKYLNEQETYLYLYTCFYIAHKYYAIANYPYDYEDFFPEDICSDSTMKKAEAFELFLISKVIDYKIFNCTFYELEEEMNNAPDSQDYYRLLRNYLTTTQSLDQPISHYNSYREMHRNHSFKDKV